MYSRVSEKGCAADHVERVAKVDLDSYPIVVALHRKLDSKSEYLRTAAHSNTELNRAEGAAELLSVSVGKKARGDAPPDSTGAERPMTVIPWLGRRDKTTSVGIGTHLVWDVTKRKKENVITHVLRVANASQSASVLKAEHVARRHAASR